MPEPPEEELRHLYESLLAFSDVMVKVELAKINEAELIQRIQHNELTGKDKTRLTALVMEHGA